MQETQIADPLSEYPFYERGKPPQYYKYHSDIDYLEEVERIWGKKWGAPGIGRLREAAVIKPTEVEVDPLFERDPSFFNFDGALPNLKKMQDQHTGMVRVYRENGVQVQYLRFQHLLAAKGQELAGKGGSPLPCLVDLLE